MQVVVQAYVATLTNMQSMDLINIDMELWRIFGIEHVFPGGSYGKMTTSIFRITSAAMSQRWTVTFGPNGQRS